MIKYQEGLGSSITFRRGLNVIIEQDDVHLYWRATAGAVNFSVYRATDRMDFHLSALTPIATLSAGTSDWTDLGAVSGPATWYYMVVPLNSGGIEGSSTYSVGVASISYKDGHNAMGLPLKPSGLWTLDYYCDNILTATGIAYMTMGLWKFHSTEMMAGVYDPFMEQGEGYQLSLDGVSSRYTYVGY